MSYLSNKLLDIGFIKYLKLFFLRKTNTDSCYKRDKNGNKNIII